MIFLLLGLGTIALDNEKMLIIILVQFWKYNLGVGAHPRFLCVAEVYNRNKHFF